MIHLTIDGQPIDIAPGRTLLEACREFGFQVPTLCYHPALEPYGACRLCMVEISQKKRPSRLVAACVYPCEEGLTVLTNSDAVQHNRRVTAELLLASSYRTPEIVALAESLGSQVARYQMPQADACVLCGLCVRACREIVGVSAISLTERGIAKKVNTPFEVASSTCIGCGTCVLICPTGRLQLRDITPFHSLHSFTSTFDRRYCKICADIYAGSPPNRMALQMAPEEPPID